MKAYGHLKPGQKGTHRLVKQFGEALLCVRYRYDEETGENLTTVEIVVDRRPGDRKLRYRDMELVAVSVPYTEKALQERLKRAGGRWDPEAKLWRVLYGNIRSESALVGRIVREL
ncbi:MAG: hypothetical protein HYS23_13175 [Geobacter sp.]|nr:hypothetical protein [Geobacter sp.]